MTGAEVPVEAYWLLSAVLFGLGFLGIAVRRNALVILMCVEMMLNAGNLALLASARATGTLDGQALALLVMAVAAAEVAVGLGIVAVLYRQKRSTDVETFRELKG